MPWTCGCGATQLDTTTTCAACGGQKDAWTVLADRTRGLVLAVGRFEVLTGGEGWTQPVADPLQAPWVPAEEGPVLSASALRDVLAAGLWPAPAHLLRVRVLAGRPREVTVDLEVEYAQAAQRSVSVPGVAGPTGELDVWVALVRDPEGAGLPARPGLVVVDVTEPGGHAPSISVSALRRPAVELPLRPAARTLDMALVEDVLFGTDRRVFLPGAEVPGPDGEAQAGLAALAAVLVACDVLPGRRLLVAGHTDTSGAADYNLALSAERARNVWLYLSGQREAWAAHCVEHDAIDDLKRVLRWVARTFGWDTDPGPINDAWTEGARVARDEFRARYNAERGGALERGVKQNAADWAAFADLYDMALAERLGTDAAGLAAHRARVRAHEPAFVGFGERWPAVGTQDGQHVAADRRVELLLFDERDLPGDPGDGAAIYGPDGFVRQLLPTDLGQLIGLAVEGDGGVNVGQWVELRAVTRRPVEGTLSWAAEGDAVRLAGEAGPRTWVSGEREAEQAPVSCALTTPLGRTYRAGHPLDVGPVAYEVAFHLQPGEELPQEPRVVLRAEDASFERELALDDPACTRRLKLGATTLHVARFDGVLPGRRYACHVVGAGGAGRCLFEGRFIDPEPPPDGSGDDDEGDE